MSTGRGWQTLRVGGAFFESPRWYGGRWWVADFYRHRVLTVDEDGGEQVRLEVPGQPSGLGWLPDGSMLVVSMRDYRVLRVAPDGSVTEHADLSAYVGGHLNDLVVDAAGRAWVGDFGFDLMAGGDPAPTVLVRIDPDGTTSVVAEDMWFPNGSVITDDGRTLIVGETLGCAYTAFDIGDDGTLGNRRTWAQLAARPTLGSFAETLPQVSVAPDGCCLDAEGAIWMADAVGARVARVVEGTGIVEQISAPAGLGIFACMLGGTDGRTLLACAAPDFAEHARSAVREAVLLTTRVDVGHAGRP
ncbi:MAG: SMP-30/gluconolactonase/LRE family protein [Actinomycetes bacterium]